MGRVASGCKASLMRGTTGNRAVTLRVEMTDSRVAGAWVEGCRSRRGPATYPDLFGRACRPGRAAHPPQHFHNKPACTGGQLVVRFGWPRLVHGSVIPAASVVAAQVSRANVCRLHIATTAGLMEY